MGPQSAVQDREGVCTYVFSGCVLKPFWVRDLTPSKSHILMQGLETLSPTPDLSSLLTSFKWISLCLRVRLRITEIIQQRNSTQPTPSTDAEEISATKPRDLLLRLPVGGSLVPRTLCRSSGGDHWLPGLGRGSSRWREKGRVPYSLPKSHGKEVDLGL